MLTIDEHQTVDNAHLRRMDARHGRNARDIARLRRIADIDDLVVPVGWST